MYAVVHTYTCNWLTENYLQMISRNSIDCSNSGEASSANLIDEFYHNRNFTFRNYQLEMTPKFTVTSDCAPPQKNRRANKQIVSTFASEWRADHWLSRSWTIDYLQLTVVKLTVIRYGQQAIDRSNKKQTANNQPYSLRLERVEHRSKCINANHPHSPPHW